MTTIAHLWSAHDRRRRWPGWLVAGLCLGLLGAACGGEDPVETWEYYDVCDAGPPDEACYVDRRDPASGRVALALDIALRYIDVHPPAGQEWDWGPATLMYSLTELYRVTGDTRLRDYYRAWMDHHLAEGYPLAWSDHCPPALTALALAEDVGGADYQAVVDDVLRYLYEEAPRIEGGISHMGTIPIADTLWLDSLFMFGMVLTRSGEASGDETHLDELRAQLLIFAELLQQDGGLFVHAYNWPEPQDPDVYWARGNAWVTVSGYEYLRVRRDRGELGDARVEAVLGAQVEAIRSTQDAQTGLWWTVLNRPGEIYLETSASALFAYGLARAYRYGFQGEDVLPVVALALQGVESRIVDDASGLPVVTGISGPTTAGDLHNYETPDLEDDLHFGVGAVILALIETSGLLD